MSSPTISFQDPWKLPLRSPKASMQPEGSIRVASNNSSSSIRNGKRNAHLTLSLPPSDAQLRTASRNPSIPVAVGNASTTSPMKKPPPFHLRHDSVGTASREPSLAISEFRDGDGGERSGHERGAPTGTIRGLEIGTERRRQRKGTTPPLTPFPPYLSDSEYGHEENDHEDSPAQNRNHHHNWRNEDEERGLRASCCGESVSCGRSALASTSMAMRVADSMWMFNSLMHGVLLSLQCVVALGVVGCLTVVAVWKRDADDEFMDWLWRCAEPAMGMVLMLTAATLLAHEIKVLSAVVLLYAQSAILVVTTVASVALWSQSLSEQNVTAKGMLMGSNLIMSGLALFAFVRVVVLWKVDVEMDQNRRRRGLGAGIVSYGTFVPWDEAR